MSNTETKRYICNNGIGGCWMLCGMEVEVDTETGMILTLEGNKNDPASKGYRCTDRITASNMNRRAHHSGQLMYPLEMVGARGENKWRRITWDEALDKIAAKLKGLIAEYGPETLAVAEGTYRMDTSLRRSPIRNGLSRATSRPPLRCKR